MQPVGGEEEEGKREWDLLLTCLHHPLPHLAAQQEQLQHPGPPRAAPGIKGLWGAKWGCPLCLPYFAINKESLKKILEEVWEVQ